MRCCTRQPELDVYHLNQRSISFSMRNGQESPYCGTVLVKEFIKYMVLRYLLHPNVIYFIVSSRVKKTPSPPTCNSTHPHLQPYPSVVECRWVDPVPVSCIHIFPPCHGSRSSSPQSILASCAPCKQAVNSFLFKVLGRKDCRDYSICNTLAPPL